MVRDGKEREQNEMANGVIVEEFMKNHQPKPRTRFREIGRAHV